MATKYRREMVVMISACFFFLCSNLAAGKESVSPDAQVRVTVGPAETAGPGWFVVSAGPISHEEAQRYFASRLPFDTTEAQEASGRPAEIVELARALRYDPKRIYDYVHNHIDYVP